MIKQHRLFRRQIVPFTANGGSSIFHFGLNALIWLLLVACLNKCIDALTSLDCIEALVHDLYILRLKAN